MARLGRGRAIRKMNERMAAWIVGLETYANRPWYLALLAGLSYVDMLIPLLPMDWILVSTSVFRHRKWVSGFVAVAAGASVGALTLAYGVRALGETRVASWIASLVGESAWETAQVFIGTHGTWAVCLLSVSPVPPQPGVIVAAAAGMPPLLLLLAVGVGKLIKYGVLSWLASRVPALYERIPGIGSRVEKLRKRSRRKRTEERGRDRPGSREAK